MQNINYDWHSIIYCRSLYLELGQFLGRIQCSASSAPMCLFLWFSPGRMAVSRSSPALTTWAGWAMLGPGTWPLWTRSGWRLSSRSLGNPSWWRPGPGMFSSSTGKNQICHIFDCLSLATFSIQVVQMSQSKEDGIWFWLTIRKKFLKELIFQFTFSKQISTQ